MDPEVNPKNIPEAGFSVSNDTKNSDSNNVGSNDSQVKALLETLLNPKQTTSVTAMENLASGLAQDNRVKYERLHDIVTRHEETIRARLKKKTWRERSEMFTSGWANMTKERHAVSLRNNVFVRYTGSVGVPSDEAALPYIN